VKANPLQTSPTQPPLILVGAIAGEAEGIAIFQDKTTKNIVRLKPGESHAGWILQNVKAREVTLQNEQRGAILTLPTPLAK
jgi:general secretion pathway protein N